MTGQYMTAQQVKRYLEMQQQVKRLREGIEQAVELLNTDANATRELLKEMIK